MKRCPSLALALLLSSASLAAPAAAATAPSGPPGPVLRVGVVDGAQPCSDEWDGQWRGLAVELLAVPDPSHPRVWYGLLGRGKYQGVGLAVPLISLDDTHSKKGELVVVRPSYCWLVDLPQTVRKHARLIDIMILRRGPELSAK